MFMSPPFHQQVPIKRPIFIATPTRTGSTLLHELFGADPNMRMPLNYEVENPVPLPEDPNIPVEQDIRYQKSWEFACKWLFQVS